MTRIRCIKYLVGAAAIAAIAIGIAACGGGSGATAQTAADPNGGSTAKPPQGGSSAAIDVRSTDLGKILVDARGRTLYLFEADTPNMSNCSDACLSLWPPFTSNAMPKAEGGADATKIGTTAQHQVTYNGHPLYYYAADQEPGETAGQGLDQFGAEWYVLAPTGDKIETGDTTEDD
jgi:predicted lipoprotein with Yx(FWY)xxD motif